MPWLPRGYGKRESKSNMGTEAWTQVVAVAGRCRSPSQHILLLYQKAERAREVCRVERRDLLHCSREQGKIRLPSCDTGTAKPWISLQPQARHETDEAVGLKQQSTGEEVSFLQGEVGKIAPNLLERNFYAEKPNQKWVTDVTEFSLFGEKLYLSPVLDLCSEDLVSYTISNRPVLGMVISMLEKAFETIPEGTGLILHSDQGWQYQHKQYQRMLESKGIRQSMSRKGNCLDNAVMENFFGLLKSELLYLQNFDSLEHFKTELIDYLDYYNNRRIKLKLKGLTPAQHRYQTLQVA